MPVRCYVAVVGPGEDASAGECVPARDAVIAVGGSPVVWLGGWTVSKADGSAVAMDSADSAAAAVERVLAAGLGRMDG